IKKDSKNGKKMSGGFGFIEFDSVDTAVRACRDLQGTNLDGFALKLQLCQAKKAENDREVDSNRSSTKFVVKNIAFEATKKDLKDLFSPFGQVFEVANKAPNLEELRARTASQFTDSIKLSKKRKYDTDLDEGNVKFKRLL
ncbi:nucleotide/nucleic acid binding protein, partial [Perilla frutescens var. frutescens]